MTRRIFDNEILDVFFELGFGKPKHFYFNSSVKDLLPSCWTKKDDKTYMCVCKTIGINAEDINVEEIDYGIKVSGETELEGFKYNTSFVLPIAESIMHEIEKIKVTSKNGLTFITLVLDKPEKKKVLIEKE